MAFKIAFIGAGSVGFTRTLLSDLLTVPEFRNTEVSFTDLSAHNLQMVTDLCQRDILENGLDIRIHATTDRREALKDADYVVVMIQVGGVDAFKVDYEIPLKYGVDQCIGDTLGPGGVFRAARHIWALMEIANDMRELCPNALLLNYANPMAICCWALGTVPGLQFVGLCHGVQLF